MQAFFTLEDVVTLASLTLTSMTPILMASVGEILAEKSGIVNIGLEGIMALSALTSAVATYITGEPWLGLALSAVIGLLMGFIHGVLSVYVKANQIVVGIGVNSIAIGIVVLGLYRVWREYGGSPPVLKLPELPLRIGCAVFTLRPLSIVAIVLAIVLWLLIERTYIGLKIKACGEDPRAAEAMGINVYLTRLLSTAVGGLLTGVAGGYLVVCWNGSFSREMVGGRGFIALANVAFSNWNALTAIAGAALFGFLKLLQHIFQLKLSKLHCLITYYFSEQVGSIYSKCYHI
jgi:simple sugar transport system permease protein